MCASLCGEGRLVIETLASLSVWESQTNSRRPCGSRKSVLDARSSKCVDWNYHTYCSFLIFGFVAVIVYEFIVLFRSADKANKFVVINSENNSTMSDIVSPSKTFVAICSASVELPTIDTLKLIFSLNFALISLYDIYRIIRFVWALKGFHVEVSSWNFPGLSQQLPALFIDMHKLLRLSFKVVNGLVISIHRWAFNLTARRSDSDIWSRRCFGASAQEIRFMSFVILIDKSLTVSTNCFALKVFEVISNDSLFEVYVEPNFEDCRGSKAKHHRQTI